MSVTVAHKTHVHLPWGKIALVAGAALAAAVILVLVNQPWESATETSSVGYPAAGAATVPKPESRAQINAMQAEGFVPTGSAPLGPHNPVRGATLDGVAPHAAEPPVAPTWGGDSSQHPLNFVP